MSSEPMTKARTEEEIAEEYCQYMAYVKAVPFEQRDPAEEMKRWNRGEGFRAGCKATQSLLESKLEEVAREAWGYCSTSMYLEDPCNFEDYWKEKLKNPGVINPGSRGEGE